MVVLVEIQAPWLLGDRVALERRTGRGLMEGNRVRLEVLAVLDRTVPPKGQAVAAVAVE